MATLSDVSVRDAQALVSDAEDETDVSIIRAEIPVASGSELDGTRLTEDGFVGPAGADDRSRTPYHVIGVWARGQFHVPPFGGVALDEELRPVRRDPGSFEGETLGEADLRERFGCSVVAIERRDGRVAG